MPADKPTLINEVYDKLLAGTSGIKPITRFDTENYVTKFGGQVDDWEGPTNFEPVERKRAAKKLDRFAQFAINAAIDAVNDSGLDFSKEDSSTCPVPPAPNSTPSATRWARPTSSSLTRL